MNKLLKEVLLPSVIMAVPVAVGFFFLKIGDNRPLLQAGYVFVALFSVCWIIYGFSYSDRQAREQRIDLGGRSQYIRFHVTRFAPLSLVPLFAICAYSALAVHSASLVPIGLFVIVGLAGMYGTLLILAVLQRR